VIAALFVARVIDIVVTRVVAARRSALMNEPSEHR
jgi:hypothetical protein